MTEAISLQLRPYLNFRLAAWELGVTQGALAQQVRGLEARLGTPFLDRLPRGLRLTEAGGRFHAPLCRAFRLIEEAVYDLSGQRQITLTVTPSFASKWLVPRLGDFTARHPDVSVQVDARERLADFQTDGVDIAVRQRRAPFGEGLVAEPTAGRLVQPLAQVLLDDLGFHIVTPRKPQQPDLVALPGNWLRVQA